MATITIWRITYERSDVELGFGRMGRKYFPTRDEANAFIDDAGFPIAWWGLYEVRIPMNKTTIVALANTELWIDTIPGVVENIIETNTTRLLHTTLGDLVDLD